MKLSINYHYYLLVSLLLVPAFTYSRGEVEYESEVKKQEKSGVSGILAPETEQNPETLDALPQKESTGDTAAPQGPKLIPEYSDPILFMSDFLDVSKKPEKPLKYWALQLVLLLKSNPRLINFCKKIKNIALSAKDLSLDQRTRSINTAFIEAYTAQLFSEELSKFIFSKGLIKVRDAIRERSKKLS